MPHQCVRCSRIYPDGSNELLKGCECGGRFFFFVKEKNLEKAKQIAVDLTDNEKKQIEQDVLDIIGDKVDDESPVVLDLESIRVIKPGHYELDLIDLFKGNPLVYKVGEGKYIVDVISTFESDKKEIGSKNVEVKRKAK